MVGRNLEICGKWLTLRKLVTSATIIIMKRILLYLSLLLTASLSSTAQKYEANYLLGNFIRAEYEDGEGKRWIEKIPNGTVIDVEKRIVGEDTADVRNIKAEFVFEGRRYTTEARWLAFADSNPEGTPDLFANDDFSPRFSALKDVEFTRMEPLSEKGRLLYGMTLPMAMFALMLIAVVILLKGSKALSVVPFVLAVGLQVYSVLMLGEDSWWWCDPHYQTLGGAIAGFIPLALYIALVFSYVILVWAFSKTEAKIWPVIVGVLILSPLAVASYVYLGTIWPGVAVALALPYLINGKKGGNSGALDTTILLIGMIELLLVGAGGALISGRIFVAMVIVCPILAFPIVLYMSKHAGVMRSGIYKRTPDGGYIVGGKPFATREQAEKYEANQRSTTKREEKSSR